MPSEKNDPREDSRGYYGAYGGYYYGEGYYSGYSDTSLAPTRGVKDYLLMLRERVWWIIVTFFVVLLGTVLYTLNSTEVYRATAMVQVLREQDKSLQFEEVVDLRIRNTEDFNTQIKILESGQIIRRVSDRLRGKELKRFMDPYASDFSFSFKGQITPERILMNNRSIVPLRMTLMVAIQFSHPNPDMAAEIANLFAEEYIKYNTSLRMEGSMKAVEDLKLRADQQRDKVEELEMQLAAFKEKYKSVSFDKATDIDSQELIKLNSMQTDAKQDLDEAESKWKMIQQAREEGRNLWELHFIADSTQVGQLLSKYSSTKIELAALAEKYRHKHPRMIEARTAYNEVKTELQKAVSNAAEAIHNNYQLARKNYENSKQRIEEKREEIIALHKIRVDYNSLLRNLDVNQQMYEYLYSRMQQTMTQATNDAQIVRVVDKAAPPLYPYKPNIPLNLAMGVAGGLGLGIGLVLLVSILDDKVKTAFDIESSLGLLLIGIVPALRKFQDTEKAQIVVRQKDKQALESFRVIHSTLNLNDETKMAKCILVTSTVPSEGKTFISSNVGLTYAAHGEKTIIVDGDLRMPNIAKSLEIDNKNGVMQYVQNEEMDISDVIQKNFQPNCDVLPTGGRTKNPTQVLTNKRFENLIHELRMRYDKIIIDSPPLAPVSDALNILPLMDGVLYVVRFNIVKRKTARLNIRRVRESNVPILGAIMNNLSSRVAGYYYSHYYDRSYQHYYLDSHLREKPEEEAGKKSGKKPDKPAAKETV